MPGWVGPVAAVSLAVIAISILAFAAAGVLFARRAAKRVEALEQKVTDLRHDVAPTMESIARIAATAQDLTGKVRDEVEEILRSSRDVRHGVDRGVRRVQHRLEELDALYEVVHDEVEDTALDVAATIRSVRMGSGALGRIRRLLVRGRR